MANTPDPKDVMGEWTARHQQFQESRARIKAVRAWLQHRVEPELPPEFQLGEKMRIKLPHPVTSSLHTVQVMGRKRPLIKRDPLGKGLKAEKAATQLEKWTNAALLETEAQNGPWWRPLVGGLFDQGEGALLAYPATAGWESFPSMYEDNGQDIKPLFMRDEKGREPEDDYYAGKRQFKTSVGASKEAYDQYLRDWKAHTLPLVARFVPAEQCLPIFGPGFRLDGLLIRSNYTVSALKQKGYRWVGGDGAPGPGRSEDEGQSMLRNLTLTELWLPGSVCYYVGGPMDAQGNSMLADRTYKVQDGQEYPAEIDLAGEYKLPRLLATYLYGAHYAEEEDPDMRGVPFLWPFLDSYRGANNFVSAKVAHAWRYAFAGMGYQVGENTPTELVLEDGRPRTWKLEAMKAIPLPGPVTPLVPPVVSNDVDEIMTVLMGSAREEGTNPAAVGGAGAASGHDRSLIRTMLEDSQDLVLEGARQGAEFVAKTFLECGSRVAEVTGHALPVYISTSGSKPHATQREHVELTADLANGYWELSAYYPNAEGENLPYAQMLMEWSIQKRIPLRMALEKGMGDPAPEETMADILAEDLLFNTPQGRALIFEEYANEVKDEKMAELFKAEQGGQATPDGTPTAALQGSPGPGQGQLQGTAVPSAVNSALGGIVAGGLQTGALRNDALASMQSRQGAA